MRRYILGVIVILLLTGCWDERILKNYSLILTVGYDMDEDEKIIKTVSFPDESGQTQDGPPAETKIISVTGDTVKGAELKTEEMSPETFDRSKSRVLIIGEDLAKKGIFPTLDSIYRDVRAALSAHVIIVEGEAKDALTIDETYSLLTSDFYANLIETSTHAGLIKKENVQSICPVILTEGKDVAIPTIALNEDKTKAKLNGVSLFSGDVLTGHLPLEQSIMYLILANQTNKRTLVNLKVTEDKETYNKNFVNFSIQGIKHKMNIRTEEGNIKAKIKMDLEIEIDEYAEDHLYSKKKADKLTKQIKKELTILAEETIAKMQEANSDALGIGEKVKAFHPATWKKDDWKEMYQDVEITPEFNVEIIRHGILN